jgi:hypothetical protein
MRWSKLKSLLEDRFAPSLARRVALQQARYRHTNEEVGRVTLTVDGREVAAFATHMGWRQVRPLADQLMEARGAWGSPAEYVQATADAEGQLRTNGVLSDAVALEDLEASLSMSLDAALAAASPLVRALAMLDRRLGKRRLRSMRFADTELALIRSLYTLRCAAEGIDITAPAV